MNESRPILEKLQVAAIAIAVFVLPLLVWPGLTDYNYSKTIASLLLISFLLILWGIPAWRRPLWTIHVPWLLIPIAGLAISATLSAIQANNVLVVLQSSTLLIYYALFLWMISSVIRSQRDVRWILIALLASGTLAALYGVLQYFAILPGPPGSVHAGAVLSTMGNRNHLGGFLLYLFYPGMILFFQAKSPLLKSLTLGTLAFTLASMMLVNQLSVQLIFPLIAIALLVGLLIFRARRPLHANRWWLTAFAGIALVVFLCMLNFTQSSIQLPPDDNDSWLMSTWIDNSGNTRAQDWLIAAEMFEDHPITGVGLGHYKLNFIASKADFRATPRGEAFADYIPRAAQAHNEYIQLGAELGIVGLVMLFGSLATLAVSLWIRLKHSDENHRIALLLLTMGILAFLAHSLVSFPGHVVGSSLELVVFCGLALSLAYGASTSFTWKLSGWLGRGVHIGLIIIGLTVSAFALADARANWFMEQGIDQVQAGLFATAEESFQRSLSLDFAPRQTYYYLAIAQIQLGKLDEAQISLQRCMTRFVDEASLLNYANLLVNTGQSEQAFGPLELLLASEPRVEIQRRAAYLRALAISETGDPEAAIVLIEDLLLQSWASETAYIGLGSIYESLHRMDEARATYETGLQQIDGALDETRAAIETTLEPISTAKANELQIRINKLIYERATLLERLRALPDEASP